MLLESENRETRSFFEPGVEYVPFQGTADLVEGLERQRVVWVAEMGEDELRRAGDREPTVDQIEVAEFESHDALKEWVSKKAPAFVR